MTRLGDLECFAALRKDRSPSDTPAPASDGAGITTELSETTLDAMLEQACKDNDVEIIKRSVEWGGQLKPHLLMTAVIGQADKAVEYLLSQGLDPNHIGEERVSPLSLWARMGVMDWAQTPPYRQIGMALLQAGGDVLLGRDGKRGDFNCAKSRAWRKKDNNQARFTLTTWEAELERKNMEARTAVASGNRQGQRL